MGNTDLDKLLEHDMKEPKKTEAPAKPKAAPAKRIRLEHPNYKGAAHVWKKDIDAWLGKGWRNVSAGNAD